MHNPRMIQFGNLRQVQRLFLKILSVPGHQVPFRRGLDSSIRQANIDVPDEKLLDGHLKGNLSLIPLPGKGRQIGDAERPLSENSFDHIAAIQDGALAKGGRIALHQREKEDFIR